MALGTGSIRFSQIVSEFGGVSPHRFSEYKALAGKGVSGIPASGTMRFSQFRGKSNQVTTSVWVETGYNQSSWVYRGSWGSDNEVFFWTGNGGYWYFNIATGRFGLPTIVRDNQSSSTQYWSNWKFTAGSNWYSNYGTRTGWRYWKKVNYYENVTSWVDTSSWQTQTTTAQIST